MRSEGRSVKVAASRKARPEARSAKVASGLVVLAVASAAVAAVAQIGCGARDAPDLFGESTGTGATGVGGAGTTSSSSGLSTSSSGDSVTTTTTTSSTGSNTTSSTGGSTSSTAEASTAASTAAASTSSSGGPMTIIPLAEGSGYLYWDKGTVGANWYAPGFDDSGWAKGTAPLGYGDGYVVTTVSYGGNANNKYITTWLRTTFDLSNAASVTSATLELIRDDGAVVYLNGKEAARSNMPNGAINANTLASSIIQGADEGLWVSSDLDPALFVEGTNLLAIEIHQSVADSSDLGIDARITVVENGP